MPRELSPAEVSVFRTAHPALGAIPENGLAVQDGSRYVLVWLDAINRWHYIDLTGATQLEELTKNKPAFVSPDGSFLDNVWDQINTVGNAAQSALKLLTVAVGVVVLVFVIIELQKVTA